MKPKIDGTLYVMRHGHTVLDVDKRSDGWLDMPLSDAGRLGVINAQQRLKTVPLTVIYCPDLKRAHETAQIIASGTLTEPKVEKADEGRTWNLGVLAGMRKRYGRPEVERLIKDPESSPLGGESFNDFHERFMPWFTEIADECLDSGEPILYVGSGSNLRLIGQEFLGDAEAIDLEEGGLAALHFQNDAWHVDILVDNKGEALRAAVDKGIAAADSDRDYIS